MEIGDPEWTPKSVTSSNENNEPARDTPRQIGVFPVNGLETHSGHKEPCCGSLKAVDPADNHDARTSSHRRFGLAEALTFAIRNCDEADALAICTAFLEDHATGGPGLAPLFERTTAEAVLWADIAPPHELLAYGTAALNRLRDIILAKNARKRLFWAIWQSFGSDDRAAFLARANREAQL